eukprot:scaffold24107_cov140-Isochrysis_galbana.AAC.1
MPPFLALCGGVVGGVVENGPDISTHISISAAHSVSSHTDRASRVGAQTTTNTCKAIMTDPPIDHTQAREQDAPGTHDAKRRAPVHGHTGDADCRRAAQRAGDGSAQSGNHQDEDCAQQPVQRPAVLRVPLQPRRFV